MAYEIDKVDIWVRGLDDLPGMLAEKLETLVRAGANFDFVIARPLENQPSAGVVFLAPLVGDAQIAAAAQVGLKKSSIHVLRIVGPDRPALAAELTRALGNADINITGMSAAGQLGHALIYLRFDSEADVDAAAQILRQKLG